MKLRLGYVSNSSSSSYTCDVCGRNESGYDLSISEIEMKTCRCYHEFCDQHMIISFPIKNIINLLEEYQEDEDIKDLYEKFKVLPPDTIFSEDTFPEDYKLFYNIFVEEEGGYDVPSCFCPVCNLDTILVGDVLSYLLKEHNLKKDDVENEIRQKFNNLEELKNHLN